MKKLIIGILIAIALVLAYRYFAKKSLISKINAKYPGVYASDVLVSMSMSQLKSALASTIPKTAS